MREGKHGFLNLLVSERFSGLEKGKEGYNEASVEPNISLLQIARLVDHLADEGEDAEECNWLDQTSVAEDEDLKLG